MLNMFEHAETAPVTNVTQDASVSPYTLLLFSHVSATKCCVFNNLFYAIGEGRHWRRFLYGNLAIDEDLMRRGAI